MADTTVYIKSEDIKVYPSGYRRAEIDLEASRTTEGSVTKANSFALGRTSYAKWDNGGNLAFSLDGYLATIEGKEALDRLKGALYAAGPEKGDGIWATLNAEDVDATVTASGEKAKMRMMVNSADADHKSDVDYPSDGSTEQRFRGISFSTAKPTAAGAVSIQLLTYDGSVWAIPDASKLNVATEQISNGAGAAYPISQGFHTGDLLADNIAQYDGDTYTLSFASEQFNNN